MNKNILKLVGLLAITVVSGSVIAQDVKVYAADLTKGKALPVFEVKQENTSANVGWKNYIFVDTNVSFQTIEGIGGAFNEIGGEALLSLPKAKQNEVMNNFFAADNAAFTFCRTAMGASDFGIDAYSYSNVPNDFEMDHFSIERDQKYVLPYIKSAFAINPDLTLFASPWSPPAWIKVSGKMEGLQPAGNKIKNNPAVLKAYALYFVKYIQEYEKAGVKVDRICIQNENDADVKYPSCIFPAKEMLAFADEYLIPAFKKNKIDAEIYAGTFRAANQMDLMDFIGCKPVKGIAGVGIQYTQSKVLADARAAMPNLKIFHTEGHCYNGANSVEQATDRLNEVAGYINSGSTTFSYWNMILNETTESGWAWKQNSLINIDRKKGTVRYNPDYNAMYIISKFVRPGDVRIASISRGDHHPILAVKSPDGTVKMLVQNTSDKTALFEIMHEKKSIKVNLPANAISAIVF